MAIENRGLKRVVVWCLRPGTTRVGRPAEERRALQTEGYGLPQTAEDDTSFTEVGTDWDQLEWDRFVQMNWPRVTKYSIKTESRGGMLRHTEAHRIEDGETVYIVPRKVRDVPAPAPRLFEVMEVEEEARDNDYNILVPDTPERESDDESVMVVDDYQVILVPDSDEENAEIVYNWNEDHVDNWDWHSDDDREVSFDDNIPLRNGVEVDICFVGGTFARVEETFKKRRPLTGIVDFIRQLEGATYCFDVCVEETICMTEDVDNMIKVGDVFEQHVQLQVNWKGDGRPGDDVWQVARRGFLMDVAKTMRDKGAAFNSFEVNLDKPWESFMSWGNEYQQSSELMVQLRTEADDGTLQDTEAVDGGGPKRLFTYRLLTEAGQKPIFVGKEGEKILVFKEEEFDKRTYYYVGAVLGLCLTTSGPSPTFAGDLFAEALGLGAENLIEMKGKVGRKEALVKGYITTPESEVLSRFEHAEDEDHLMAAAESIEAFTQDWSVDDSLASYHTLEADKKRMSELAMYEALFLRHKKGYEQLEEGLGKMAAVIRRHPLGFLAVCREPDEVPATDVINRMVLKQSNMWPIEEQKRAFDYLKRFTQECEEGKHGEVTVGKILMAFTGMPKLEMSGNLKSREISVTFVTKKLADTRNWCLPEFSTCFKQGYLVLPCPTFEDMARRMSCALTWSRGQDIQF